MKPKIRRKDYESKSEYLNALVVRYWWQILLVFSVVTIIISLITYFINSSIWWVFLIIYGLFTVTMIGGVRCAKKQQVFIIGCDLWTILFAFILLMLILFIQILL